MRMATACSYWISTLLLLTTTTSSVVGQGQSASPAWPVQLVAPSPHGQNRLKVVDSGLRALESLKAPVAMVAVVGPYHSGKSFLLNNLAVKLGGSKGKSPFEVGKSVDPETRGIWAYHVGRVQLGERKGDVELVLLDTEGFAVANVSEAYDSKVFAASTILSSTLLYNSMHVIDSHDLEYVDLLAHNTQLFALKTSTIAGQETVAPPLAPNTTHSAERPRVSPADMFSLPPLLWTIQAFTLNLQGETCTSWLKRMMAGAVSTDSHQQQRLGIDGLFPSIQCHTLYLPATSRSQLHHLANVTQEQMTPEYQEDIGTVSASVLGSIKPKTRGGRPLAGADFSAMVRIIVDALNHGVLADIPSRWGAFEKHLQVSTVRAAVGHFEAEVTRAFKNRTVPLAGPAMKALTSSVKSEAVALVPRLLVGLEASVERAAVKEVERHIKDIEHRLVSENQKAVRDFVAMVREHMDDRDAAIVAEQVDKLLPLPSATLQAYSKEREESTKQEWKASTLAYQGDASYSREFKALQAKISARTRRFREQNVEAITQLLRVTEADVFQRYAEDIGAAVGDGAVLSTRIDELQKISAARAKASLSEKLVHFQSEPQFHACASRLSASMQSHAKSLHAVNGQRLETFCSGVRTAILANATETAKALYGSSDERAVEGAVKAIKAVVASFSVSAGVHAKTLACRKHQQLLHKEAEALHHQQRQQLAANLRELFQEPLQEICKVVVEAQCRLYRTRHSLQSFVSKECGKWVRRAPQGANLSEPTLQSVLQLFMERDLAVCVEEVKAQEALDTTFWWQFVGCLIVVTLVPLFFSLFRGRPSIKTVEGQQSQQDQNIITSGGRRRRSSLSSLWSSVGGQPATPSSASAWPDSQ